MLLSALLTATVLVGCSSSDNSADPVDLKPAVGIPADDSAMRYTEGVVTAAHPLAAEAGAKVLEDGGNAIDAAAVVQFVLNVVEPTSSGIGGGGFMRNTRRIIPRRVGLKFRVFPAADYEPGFDHN